MRGLGCVALGDRSPGRRGPFPPRARPRGWSRGERDGGVAMPICEIIAKTAGGLHGKDAQFLFSFRPCVAMEIDPCAVPCRPAPARFGPDGVLEIAERICATSRFSSSPGFLPPAMSRFSSPASRQIKLGEGDGVEADAVTEAQGFLRELGDGIVPKKLSIYEHCPYTLRRLAEIEADPKSLDPPTNDEHIIPDAIGGTKEFTFRAETRANSDLGTKVDFPLLNSFLINGLRLMYGIKSRSGDPKLTLQGTILTGNKVVEMTFWGGGDITTHVRRPVEVDSSGNKIKVVVPASERDAFVANFIKNHARKGKTAVIEKEWSLVGEPLSVNLEIDLLAIKRALAKIAYGAIYEHLGDEYLHDPMVVEWRRMLFSDDPEEVKRSKIHGVAFDVEKMLSILLPPLKPHEHGVAVANLRQRGPVVAVSLFGGSFHSLVALASEFSNYGMEELDGKISICDAKAGTMKFIDFREHFLGICGAVPLS